MHLSAQLVRTFEYLYGVQPVLGALLHRSRIINQLLLYATNKHKLQDPESPISKILSLAQEQQIPVHYTTRTQLDDYCEQRPHQASYLIFSLQSLVLLERGFTSQAH